MSKPEKRSLERDYCANVLSLRELAEIYGITEGAIRKRAAKYGWVRSEKKSKRGTQKSAQSGAQVRKNGTQKTMRTKASETCAEERLDDESSLQGESKGYGEFTLDPSEYGISEQQAQFAEYIFQGKTRVAAYRLANYESTGHSAYSAASRLLRNVKVSRYLYALRNERQKRYHLELDDLINQLSSIIKADPNEISQYRRVNCRYCWGENHLYQWRDIPEFDGAAAQAASDGKPEPEYGGLGFVETADPNPECPRCNGEGNGQPFFADTRDLEGDARYLLQGVRLGKFGIEILTADKDAARRELARLLAVRSADTKLTELNIRRLELQNEKLQAEIDSIRIERDKAAEEPPQGVIIVPGCMNVDEWERAAQAQQGKLLNDH